MALESIPSSEALSRVRSAAEARWPDGRTLNARMHGVVDVVPRHRFSFGLDDGVITIGSCFARNIEGRLQQLGFDLPMTKIVVPREERVSETANDILNKYTIHSMETEVRWAFEPPNLPYEDLFLRTGDGLWHDPQLAPNLVPATFERVLERRQMVAAAFSELPRCKVVIATLGLAESWYDVKTSLYLNGIPPNPTLRAEPDRFFLHVLSYEEILEGLERLRATVKAHGHPDVRMLITVSPVPFKASFSGTDALAANCYSKSVQRAACEAFVRKHNDVDYFPSYEVVTLSGPSAFMPDNIHVKAEVVSRIMDRVTEIYGSETGRLDQKHQKLPRLNASSGVKSLQATAGSYFAQKDYWTAARIYEFIFYNFESKLKSKEKADLYTACGVTMLRARETVAGVEMLRKALPYDVDNARLNYKLGLGVARLGADDEALQWFARAMKLDDTQADYPWRYGVQLMRMRQPEKALPYLEHAVRMAPIDERYLTAVGQAKGKLGDAAK